MPSADPALRENLQQQLQQQGAIALHERLTQLDAVAAAKIHPNNHQRLLRALEVIETTGKAISSQWQNADSGGAEQRLPIKLITAAVVPEQREVLHTRIATRFDAMLQLGFVAEVEKLMQRGDLHPDLPALRAVGYRQAWQFLRGEVSHADFVDKGVGGYAPISQAPADVAAAVAWNRSAVQCRTRFLAEQLLQKL